jgi:hypothetical protein
MARARGVQRADLAVDGEVPCLLAVRAVRGTREGERVDTCVQLVRAVAQAEFKGQLCADSPGREVEPQHHAQALLGQQVTKRDDQLARLGDARLEAGQRRDLHAGRRAHQELGVRRHDLETFDQLLTEQARDLVGVADQAEVAAARARHAAEQDFVEALADAEGRGDDATQAQLSRVPLQFDGVGDAMIGQPVGHEQAAGDLSRYQVLGNLAAAGQPALREIGEAALGQGRDGRRARGEMGLLGASTVMMSS